MNSYTMEELLPVVSWLTSRYTSKESSSVTYETARTLMEAVQYCIQHSTNEMQELVSINLNADERSREVMTAYERGYANVLDLVSRVKDSYHRTLSYFCSYHNENLRDSFVKAIPGFLLHYDARYRPQDTILTLDYPVFHRDCKLQGVDAVLPYVQSIDLEQQFLSQFPVDSVLSILSAYQADYAKQFYNITQVVLRNLLGCIMSGRKPGMGIIPDCDHLTELALLHTQEEIKVFLKQILERFLKDGDMWNQELSTYLSYDFGEFSYELYQAARDDCMLHKFHV